jgi:uncharacterized protein (DUF4415 family)
MEARGEVFETPKKGAPTYSLDEAFWRTARLVIPGAERKESVHLRIDNDVLDWFRKQGKGHLTRMNAVLRAFYQANRGK